MSSWPHYFGLRQHSTLVVEEACAPHARCFKERGSDQSPTVRFEGVLPVT
jgi:hypothetical protein